MAKLTKDINDDMKKPVGEIDAKLNAVLDALADFVIIYDQNGTVRKVNKALVNFFEFDPTATERTAFKTVLQLHHKNGRIATVDEYPSTRALKGEPVISERFVVVARDEAKTLIEVSAIPILENGTIEGAVVVMHDVTEHEHALEDIRESRWQVLDVLESISDGFFALDSLWRITYINKKAQEFLGVSKVDVLFQSLWEKLPNSKVLRLYKELHHAVENNTSASFEEFIEPFGKWFEFHIYPYKQGMSVYFSDITERKQIEETLRESEQRIKSKLESILSPGGDIGNLDLEDIIDAPALQSLMDDFYNLAHIPVGIIDLKGKVLVGVGWQDVCTKFHRTNPNTCSHCTESDLELTKGISTGEFRLYKCKNNMWDAATPVMVGGQHMGNLFWGQFFFDDEPLDYDFFRSQAQKYGFDKTEYLAALEKVPRISRETLNAGMIFYEKLADMVSKLSYSNIKLAGSLAERDRLTLSLRESQALLRAVSEGAVDAIFVKDRESRWLMANPATLNIVGVTAEQALGKSDDEIFADAETGKQIMETDRRIMDSGKAEVVEERILTRDGLRIFSSSKAPRFDADGRVVGLIGVAHDITEQKQEAILSAALNEVNASLSSTLDIDMIMRRVVEEGVTAIDSESGAITLRENGVWTVRQTYGLPEETGHVVFADNDIKHFALAAKMKKPLVVNDIYSDKRVDLDALKDTGIRSFIAAPLLSKDKVIGMLTFHYRSTSTIFASAQIDFAEKLAASLSLAVENAKLYDAEHNIANTLQEALLAIPKSVPGVDCGFFYRSSTEKTRVGGDFYDIFELGEDRVGVVIGDVSGKGLNAATLTSLVKNTIRAYAYISDSPAKVMSLTNDIVINASPPSSFVSVFFGTVDKRSGVLAYCSGGHPPAIIKQVSGKVELLKTDSPIVGAFTGLPFVDEIASFENGDLLLLYTDGVTEARCNDGFYGEERLVNFIANLSPMPAKEVPEAVFKEVIMCANSKLPDDVALLSLSLTHSA